MHSTEPLNRALWRNNDSYKIVSLAVIQIYLVLNLYGIYSLVSEIEFQNCKTLTNKTTYTLNNV